MQRHAACCLVDHVAAQPKQNAGMDTTPTSPVRREVRYTAKQANGLHHSENKQEVLKAPCPHKLTDASRHTVWHALLENGTVFCVEVLGSDGTLLHEVFR